MGERDQDQEQQVKKLKRLLEGWRNAIIPLKSVILWDQQWHPAAIFATVSFVHLLIWLLDLNFLTTVAVVGLIVNAVDFLVPVICNSIYSPNSWTGQKEKVFEDICRGMVANYNKIISQIRSFYSLRETSPVMYYLISICILFVLAWISSSMNNILLLYIFSTAALMWPGLQHHGMLNMILALISKAPKTVKSE